MIMTSMSMKTIMLKTQEIILTIEEMICKHLLYYSKMHSLYVKETCRCIKHGKLSIVFTQNKNNLSSYYSYLIILV